MKVIEREISVIQQQQTGLYATAVVIWLKEKNDIVMFQGEIEDEIPFDAKRIRIEFS